MSVRLTLAELAVPTPLRRAGLNELAEAAAATFGCSRPRWEGRDYSTRLAQFARFTSTQTALAWQAGRSETVKRELRRNAEALGVRLRRRLGVRSHDEALRALKVLYGQLDIDVDAPTSTRIEMASCFFSRYYDPAACQVMSAMDEGIVSGLTGGCVLRFERRITEGADSCVATLTASAAVEPCARS